jgi:hypothetical protein
MRPTPTFPRVCLRAHPPLAAAVVACSLALPSPGFARLDDPDEQPGMQEMDTSDSAQMGGGEQFASDRPLTQAEIDFFEKKIRPVLVAQCYACHSAQATRLKGELLLDTREGTLKGGNIGAAVVPGYVDESLLIQAIRYEDQDLEMPPKGKLSADVIRDFETWVAMGAPDPRSKSAGTIDAAGPDLTGAAVDIEKGRQFWAFQRPVKPAAPEVTNVSWPLGELDRFTLASMEAVGAAPTEDAERRVWLRRVTFDLTGLPPTVEELEAFERDKAGNAYERAVDRLLASTAFGERWGRHWLDVARYGESSGKESNVIYPHAWRYRDYVIDSFNKDKPFDRFVREQIAGDLLPYANETERAEQLVATAYLALGPKSHSAQNPRQFAADLADEQIDAVTQGFLGVTVACARCHDHKFDPIPQRDYYALAGIFLSTRTAFGTERSAGNRHVGPLVELPAGADISTGPTMPVARRSLIEAAAERLAREAEKAAEEARGAERDNVQLFRIKQQRDQSKVLETILERFDAEGNSTEMNRVTMGVVEGTRMIDAPLLTRGEIDKPAERVPRGLVQVLASGDQTDLSELRAPDAPEGSGRAELAAWIASPDHPLTARVWANRVWLHLFGRGIVPTPDNFGNSGVPPTDQRLLDWLSQRLVEHRWSTKSLIREIVLSHTYRLASHDVSSNTKADPENTTFWRYPNRRLEAEAIRDAMLAAAGTLDTHRPVGSVVNFAEGALRGPGMQQLVQFDTTTTTRSVYLPIVRDQVPEALELFDFAEPAFVSGDRAETNVATQALYLMNAPEVMRAADAFSQRLLASKGSDNDRIVSAFQIALGRKPIAPELNATRDFLRDFAKANAAPKPSAERPRNGGARGRLRDRFAGRDPADAAPSGEAAAWSAFCQTLFQSAEFRTIR